MTIELFNRSFTLTIQKTTGFFTASAENQIKITSPMRITFSSSKTLGETPNKSTITIYNLAERTRAALQEKPLFLTLEVGHDGVTSRVISGDIKNCRSMHRSPDFETTIQVGDGERAYRHARVSRSFGKGVDIKTILTEVAGSMGLKVPQNASEAVELAKTLAGGVALEGPSSAQMTKILKARGMGWSIQDGRLQILKENETRRDLALVIAPPPVGDMIGSPEFSEPKKDGGPPVLLVSCILRPQVTPGCRIQVSSRRINGVFRVETAKHDGDSHGQNWTTSMEAKQL